jgi:tetratricopeptide (TPR) repeat protein
VQQNETTQSLINRIKRTLTRADNTFALFFVLVNLPETRKHIAKQLIKQLHRPVVEISVSQEALQDTTLDAWLLPQLKAAPEESVVFLHNLQEILPTKKKALRHYLQQLNYRRSSLAAIQRPLVIWLPRYAIDKLAEYAADFYDWYSNVYEFIPSAEDVDQITSRFVTEFESKDVHPAERMSSAEKQKWLHTLTALLDENPDQNKFRAKLLANLGRLHDAIGNLDNALEHYEQCLAIQQEIGDKSGEGKTLNNISHIYYFRGDYDTALNYLKQSLAIQEEIGDKSGEGETLIHISHIYYCRGDYDTALTYMKQSLAIQEKIGDKSGKGKTLNNISHIYYFRGDYDTALNYLKQSLAIQQEIGDKSGKGETLNNISHIFKARGDYDTALSYLKQSLAIQEEIGDKSGEGGTLIHISHIYYFRGDYDTALTYMKQSLAIQQEIGDKSGKAGALINISHIFKVRGDYDTALNYLKQSLTIQQEIGDIAGLCATLFNIGHIQYQNKEIPQSMQTWVSVYRLAKPMNLAQALDALENLAEQLKLPSGIDGWERLAKQMEEDGQ